MELLNVTSAGLAGDDLLDFDDLQGENFVMEKMFSQ